MSEDNKTKAVETETVASAPSENTKRKCPPKRRQSDQPKTSAVIKRAWKKFRDSTGSKVSLKKFLATAQDLPVKEWKDHKKGSLEKLAKVARNKLKGGRILAEKTATKLSRRKTKGPAKAEVK